MDLVGLAKEKKDNLLRPFGHTEVLLYYGIVATKLKKFLHGKEIAAKNWIPKGFLPYLIKRGSKSPPLFIEEFSDVVPKFLETRGKIENLKDARAEITKTQSKIWDYFLPRKLSDFFYATNSEGAGKELERIFYDIDRKGQSVENAQIVASKFIETIKKDKSFRLKYKIFVMWTGSSFHVYLMLKQKITSSFYNKEIHFSKDKPLESFTGRWAEKIKHEAGIKVIGGHEKKPGYINIDPSQSPSGKLARCPFSLHMRTARDIDGVAIPLKEEMLKDKNLIKKLKAYTPEKVITELDKLAENLP